MLLTALSYNPQPNKHLYFFSLECCEAICFIKQIVLNQYPTCIYFIKRIGNGKESENGNKSNP